MATFENLTNNWQNIANSNSQFPKQDNSDYFQSSTSDNDKPGNIHGSPKKISRNPKWDQYEQSIKPGINQYLKDLGLNKDYDNITLAEIQYNPKVDKTLIDQIKQRDSNRNPFMSGN